MTEKQEDAVLFAFDTTTASLKRLARAYGCARKGSDQERQLLAALVQRIQGGT